MQTTKMIICTQANEAVDNFEYLEEDGVCPQGPMTTHLL